MLCGSIACIGCFCSCMTNCNELKGARMLNAASDGSILAHILTNQMSCTRNI